jgi:hypothetical protein
MKYLYNLFFISTFVLTVNIKKMKRKFNLNQKVLTKNKKWVKIIDFEFICDIFLYYTDDNNSHPEETLKSEEEWVSNFLILLEDDDYCKKLKKSLLNIKFD